jgi:hypothetical protein
MPFAGDLAARYSGEFRMLMKPSGDALEQINGIPAVIVRERYEFAGGILQSDIVRFCMAAFFGAHVPQLEPFAVMSNNPVDAFILVLINDDCVEMLMSLCAQRIEETV